jgi:ankyrin repeat protein
MSKPGTRIARTPLMWAAYDNPDPEVIITLLQAGADIKAQNVYGVTALMCAAETNTNPGVIITLLKAGADAKVKNKKGHTAFDYAKNNYSLIGSDALKQLEEASK